MKVHHFHAIYGRVLPKLFRVIFILKCSKPVPVILNSGTAYFDYTKSLLSSAPYNEPEAPSGYSIHAAIPISTLSHQGVRVRLLTPCPWSMWWNRVQPHETKLVGAYTSSKKPMSLKTYRLLCSCTLTLSHSIGLFFHSFISGHNLTSHMSKFHTKLFLLVVTTAFISLFIWIRPIPIHGLQGTAQKTGTYLLVCRNCTGSSPFCLCP